MELVDLSHPFDPEIHDRQDGAGADLVFRSVKTVGEDGVNSLEITFGNHIGTHVDAPRHLIADAHTVDQLPLHRYHGTAAVLEMPKGPNSGVNRADLEAAQPEVREGDIVIVHTGWGDRLHDPTYPSHHPYLTEDGAEWLVARQVRMVGMDVQSVDLPHSLRGPGFCYTSLRVLLSNGIPALHNLTNLKAIAGQRATVWALPVNFRGADGAPARVVARPE